MVAALEPPQDLQDGRLGKHAPDVQRLTRRVFVLLLLYVSCNGSCCVVLCRVVLWCVA